MRRIVITGAGGHAKVVIETIRATNAFEIAGVIDPKPPSQNLLGVPWLGPDESLPALWAQGIQCAAVALGSNRLRQTLGENLLKMGYQLPIIVHPSAQVSSSARIGQGTIIMARACVGPLADIGDLCIINTAAIVEHDNVVGLAAHIAPGVALGGTVHIGDRTLIGIGSSVRPGISLGRDIVVGAGSAVVSNFSDSVTIGGVPARILPPSRETIHVQP
jgi:UDP-perosamine 4-acetyltransferase